MKNAGRRFAILCIFVLLTGGTALAISGRVSNMKNPDANVKVETFTSSTGDPMFRITRDNAEDGKLYTVLIRSGDEDADPKAGPDGNLVYMDVVKAENGVASISDVYPMEMTEGTYRVFMSDYKMGKIKEVATFDVGGPNPSNVILGDIDNDGIVTAADSLCALQMFAGIKNNGIDWTEAQMTAADVDGDGYPTAADALMMLQMFAGLLNSDWSLKQ